MRVRAQDPFIEYINLLQSRSLIAPFSENKLSFFLKIEAFGSGIIHSHITYQHA